MVVVHTGQTGPEEGIGFGANVEWLGGFLNDRASLRGRQWCELLLNRADDRVGIDPPERLLKVL